MQSLRSRLLLFMLRYSHLLKFKLKRETFDWNTSIPKWREETEKKAVQFGKIPVDIKIEPTQLGNIYGEWILPAHGKTDKVILYFHGGIYVLGSCKGHRTHVAKFVKGIGIGALLFEYRLAPEHPFPAALDDSIAAYQWLLSEGYAPSQIAFIGDSAGAGLCLATLVALRDKKIPLPTAAVSISPWTDLKLTGESHKTNENVCLSPKGCAVVCSKYYAGDNDPGLPWISPLYADLAGLPPLRIYVGSSEILLDDSTRFAEKAKAAGVDVHLTVGQGLFHCYPVCAPMFPEATQAMNEIWAFVRKHLKLDNNN